LKESFWGIFVIFMGVLALTFIVLFQNITNTEYRATGTIKINREKFVENFLRRYAQSASRSRDYEITFYDINEQPPKVSLKVGSKVAGSGNGDVVTFDLNNRIDAILEAKY